MGAELTPFSPRSVCATQRELQSFAHMRAPTAFVSGVVASGVLAACGMTSPAEMSTGDGSGGLATGGSSTGGSMTGGAGSGSAAAAGGQAAGGDASGGGGTIAGSGGAAAGGQGSGGAPPFCPGVIAECMPGTQACSPRGERTTCSECGEIELANESCVRLLASDKELGMLCTVRGERELLCAGGSLEWADVTFPIELPSFVAKLRLPDDVSSVSIAPIPYCFVTEDGGFGCAEGLSPPGASGCTDLVLSDGPKFCSLCNGTLECPDAAATSVVAVAISDTYPFWLNVDGEIHWPVNDELQLPGTYESFFMDDNMVPCGIEADGTLVCADVDFVEPPTEVEGPFVRGSAGPGYRRCAIGEDGTLTCFTLQAGIATPAFAPPGNDFTEVVVSSLTSCALTRLGEVVCWDAEGLLTELSDQLN